MSIRYSPSKVLKKMAPDAVIEKLVSSRLTVNRAALNMLHRAGLLDKDELEDVAIRVIGLYKDKYEGLREDGETKRDAFEGAVNDKRLMVQQVKNASLQAISERIEERYRGTRYKWLPSTAKVQDPTHRRRYGKIYILGRGEKPGDRRGCQCGMEILTDGSRLNLDEVEDSE